MKKEEIRSDDYLGNLIRQCPIDSPSDDFVARIMASVQAESAFVTEKKSYYLQMKSMLPYAALVLFCLIIFATSDLPFLSGLPGKDYFLSQVVPYFASMMAVLESAFASKYITWGLLVSFAGVLLFAIDRFFSRRTAV